MTDHVDVEVATVWTGPLAPRTLDAAAIADVPDLPAWLATLDADPALRLGLHGRTLTQGLRGEPVEVAATHDGWAQVRLPWQSSARHPDGYPGWVRRAHVAGGPAAPRPSGSVDRAAAVEAARKHLGLLYLWGGLSSYGLDCSGLVHLAYRTLGVLLPRDALDQAAAVTAVALDAVEPGDLYFFGRPGAAIHHVGFATRSVEDGVRWMLHAPEGGRIEEAPMAPEREALLVAAGRVV